MKFNVIKLGVSLLTCSGLLVSGGFAQKVRVGYDKGVDFSRYTSYTWAEPTMPPTRPLVYANVVGSIDNLLLSKGLKRRENNGDLILVPTGGVDFGLNQAAGTPIVGTYSGAPPAIDATMWTGAGGSSSPPAPYVTEGALTLTFVDRGLNKVIWTGTVMQKLDMEHKTESLQLVERAVTKLLKEFPPAKK